MQAAAGKACPQGMTGVEREPLFLGQLGPQAGFFDGLAILAFVLSRVEVNVAEIRGRLAQTNLPLFLGAMALYYLTFPIRALRWQQLLKSSLA